MKFVSAHIFLGMIAVLGLALWGLVAKPRSPLIGVIAAAVALMAAGGAWYAWAETKSVPWTVGDGVVALACVASAKRQLFGDPLPTG
jgi:aspartate oxidase